MSESRISAVLLAATAACIVLSPTRGHAQWWSARGPADFEECADTAEKAATREDKSFQLSECQSKFAGRRKPGGGYTYFDFMQNRNFDIAGPNPTPDEQRKIDEQYTVFLESERQKTIAAALMAKHQQVQQASLKQASLKQSSSSQPASHEKPSAPAVASKPLAGGSELRTRIRADTCARHSFSCDWPRLSEGIKDLKKLFSPSSSKAKRS